MRPGRPAFGDRLSQLMELYEQNYSAVRLLIPGLARLHGEYHVSRVDGCLPLHLRIEERSRYTTTLNLSYRFSDGSHAELAPDLSLRVYQDARLAEAMSGLIHGQHHVQRRVRDLHDGWRLNRFLYRWLRYCQRRGHRFGSHTACRTLTEADCLEPAQHIGKPLNPASMPAH